MMKDPKDMTDAELDAESVALQRTVNLVVTERRRRRVAACDHDWQLMYDRDQPQGRKSYKECSFCVAQKDFT